MFDFTLSASEPEIAPLDPSLVNRTADRVARWLLEEPNADDLFSHLPALEFALARHLKNHNIPLLRLVQTALERMDSDAGLTELRNQSLAALMLLSLRAGQAGVQTAFAVAQHAIAIANRRWQEEGNYFKPQATDSSGVLDVRANAQMGEAFYFAWRALEDQQLRPTAGEILGHVSTAFDENAALNATDDAPLFDSNQVHQPGTIAAAMDLFLTASETTGRGTYLPRAIIAANHAPGDEALANASPADRIAFARALLRLEQFTGERAYTRRARAILASALRGLDPGIENAGAALAVTVAEYFPLHISVIGDVEADLDARALWFAAMNLYAPVRAIEVLHPVRHIARLERLGYHAGPGALAYICTGPVCLPPVSSVAQLMAAAQRAQTYENS